MKKAIRWIVILGLLGAAIGGGLWFRNRQQATAQAVEILRTGEVVRDNLELTVAASGNVVVERRVDLAFETPGTVRSVDVAVGDRVKAGATLAQLDDDALVDATKQAEIALAQANLNLEQAGKPADEADVRLAELAIREAVQAMEVADTSAALAQIRAAIDQTRAQELEKDARDAYEKYTDILDDYGLPLAYASGITAMYMEAEGNVGITQLRSEVSIQQAQSQWLAANQRYAKAKRDLENLQAGLDENQIKSLELQVEQAQLSLEQAQADLASARLIAPFDGVVAAVNLQPGTAAPSLALPAVTLLDDSTIYVDLSIDEIDIGSIDPDQAVALTLDAYPEAPLDGVVDRIGALSDVSGGVIAYSVRVRLSETGDVAIRDGMTASARVTVGQIQDVLMIPSWAIRTDQTNEVIYTYRMNGGVPQRVTIETGARNDTWTEVTSGLSDGDTVALVTESQGALDFQGGPPSGMQP